MTGKSIKHAADCPCDDCELARGFNLVTCWLCDGWVVDASCKGVKDAIERLQEHITTVHTPGVA